MQMPPSAPPGKPPVAGATGFGVDAPVEDPNASPIDQNAEPEAATEQEQAEYDLVVSRAVKFIHGPGKEKITKLLSTGNSPAETVGTAAASIAKQVHSSIKQQGGTLSDGVLFHAGLEIVEVLMDYGVGKGLFQFANDEEMQQQGEEAFLQALRIYGESGLADGSIDEAEINESRAIMEQGVDAEEKAGVTPVLPPEAGAQQQGAAPPAPGTPPEQPKGLVGRVAGGM